MSERTARPIDFDPTVDHYKVLGVQPTAAAHEIKKAYRELAKRNHPDSTGGDKSKESRFKEISNAYEVLGDAKKRAQYDQVREYARSGGGPGGFESFGGQGFPGGFQGGGFAGGQAFNLDDLFGQFFTRSRVRPEPAEDAEFESKLRASDGSWLSVKGVDIVSELRIPFERAILGTVAEIATVDGKAKVKIPPGTASGKKLRLRGKGVTAGRRTGDHYVTIQIDVPSGEELDDDLRKDLIELAAKLKKSGKK
jgi:DnaJ-class molecular chaperone